MKTVKEALIEATFLYNHHVDDLWQDMTPIAIVMITQMLIKESERE